jgi:hypothetical protein
MIQCEQPREVALGTQCRQPDLDFLPPVRDLPPLWTGRRPVGARVVAGGDGQDEGDRVT